MKVSEPAELYDLHSLQNKVIALTQKTNEVEKLQNCLTILENDLPCTFTDEEFKEELRASEQNGFVGNEEFKQSCLEKWGVEL